MSNANKSNVFTQPMVYAQNNTAGHTRISDIFQCIKDKRIICQAGVEFKNNIFTHNENDCEIITELLVKNYESAASRWSVKFIPQKNEFRLQYKQNLIIFTLVIDNNKNNHYIWRRYDQ